MMKRLNSCSNCHSKFVANNLPSCATCGNSFCPQCSGCLCTANYKSSKVNSSTKVTINELISDPSAFLGKTLEITGTISPLKTQKPVKTKKGMVLLSSFDFSEGQDSLNLKIWAPLPNGIFQNRYKFNDITIKGLKLNIFNDKYQLILKNKHKISYSIKHTNLESFLSLA